MYGRELHEDFFQEIFINGIQSQGPDSLCEVEHCGLNATPNLQPLGNTIVNEEDCNPELYPHGHWTRLGRKPNPLWNSTGHRMMYGSIAVQHTIWHHQHPKSCKGKKFIVYQTSGNGNGIGSVLHRTTIILQAALNLGRILVLYPQPHGQWIDGPFCIGAYTIDSCYFEPISSCSIWDAMGHHNWEDLPYLDANTYQQNVDQVLKYDYEQSWALYLIRSTPVMFHKLLKAGKIPTNSYYWWRAQGVAYLVRPNVRTLEELESRRVKIFQNSTIRAGVVSVHVRHGDKGNESPLAADEAYLSATEALVAASPELKRSIFLSTEDANTVRFFARLRNWTVQWTKVKRQGRRYQGSTAEFARMVGWDNEFLNGLLNLQLALDCDAWVGMISSNWNRLVDELRSTIRCKYDQPYVDVFVGTNITDYDWR